MKTIQKVIQMKTQALKLIVLFVVLAMSSTVFAQKNQSDKTQNSRYQQFVYGKVLDVTPIYRQVRVSKPVQECWSEPVRYPRTGRLSNNSTGNTLAGGLIGGIIGHQIGQGRGKDLATAVGTIIGAQAGHNASRDHYDQPYYDRRDNYYEEHCETKSHMTYQEVVDGYKVSYRYQGKRYQTEMSYDPGEKIKLRISVEPVF